MMSHLLLKLLKTGEKRKGLHARFQFQQKAFYFFK